MAKGGRGGKRGITNSSANQNNGFVDNSRYAKKHNEIVDFVKQQINLDLNKYRDGDGSRPNMTSYWDKNGSKVAIDLKGMSSIDRNNLMDLTNRYNKRLVVETGGAWIGYVYLKNKK